MANPHDVDLGGGVVVTGYPAEAFAEGFSGTGAWVRLGAGALRDLVHGQSLSGEGAAFWDRTAVFFVAPALDAPRHGGAYSPDALNEALGLAATLALPGPPARLRAASGGPTGLAATLRAVSTEPPAQRLHRHLVVAADTYLDAGTVDWLAGARRLKHEDAPTGVMPGEAGAALLVETEQAARQRKAAVLGWIEAAAVHGPVPPAPLPPKDAADPGGDEPDAGWRPPAAPKLGRSIAGAVRKVLPATPGDRWRGDLYLDLNGEHWKAEAWGHANVHLVKHVDLDGCRVFLPADSLGETGAASAPIAVAFALWNFDRDRTGQAIVVSIADDGAASAIRLSAAH
jgi:3-oxoacyl-[acyl-carrier-protein] synthase-1